MVGRLFAISFIPGAIFGLLYLTGIMYFMTGYTPIDLLNTVTDTIIQPLQQVAKVLR